MEAPYARVCNKVIATKHKLYIMLVDLEKSVTEILGLVGAVTPSAISAVYNQNIANYHYHEIFKLLGTHLNNILKNTSKERKRGQQVAPK